MGNATARRIDQQLGQTTGGAKLFSEVEAREEFSSLVLPYSPRQLSRMAGVTPEGARHWVDASRTPNLASAINVARHLPTVQDWVALRCGIERMLQAKSYDVWFQGLYAIAGGNGPDAMKARWAIGQLTRTDDREPVPERDTRTIDLFTRRRA